MKSHARLALAFASLATTVAASGVADAGLPGGSIGGGSQSVDVLGAGQSVNSSWTLVDYDASRIGLGAILQRVNGVLSDVSNLNLNQALGVPSGLNLGTPGSHGVTASIDADATANVSASAYVNPPSYWGGSSMGVHGQAKLGAYLNATAAGSSVNPSIAPSATVDLSYVRPGITMCWMTCNSSGPYYHPAIYVRDVSGAVAVAVDSTQADPLAYSKPVVSPSIPSPSPIDLGNGVTITPTVTGFGAVLVTGSLNAIGGGSVAIDIAAAAKASVAMDASYSVKTDVASGSVSADATVAASLLDGPPLTFASAWFPNATAAQAHGVAYVNATWSSWGGNQLCYGARGSLDVDGVAGWHVGATAGASGNIGPATINTGTQSLYDDGASGASYHQAFQPIDTCIPF